MVNNTQIRSEACDVLALATALGEAICKVEESTEFMAYEALRDLFVKVGFPYLVADSLAYQLGRYGEAGMVNRDFLSDIGDFVDGHVDLPVCASHLPV